MNQKNNFRNNGAIGALLDEYEKSINELIDTISDLSQEQLIKVVDFETNNEDCKSIQSILTHVIQSGYTYVIEIKKWLGEEIEYKEKRKFENIKDYIRALQKMFEFNEKLFTDYPNLKLNEYDSNKKISVRWGQKFDVEQLFEHAIVHILRHRRQIKKFKERMTNIDSS